MNCSLLMFGNEMTRGLITGSVVDGFGGMGYKYLKKMLKNMFRTFRVTISYNWVFIVNLNGIKKKKKNQTFKIAFKPLFAYVFPFHHCKIQEKRPNPSKVQKKSLVASSVNSPSKKNRFHRCLLNIRNL